MCEATGLIKNVKERRTAGLKREVWYLDFLFGVMEDMRDDTLGFMNRSG